MFYFDSQHFELHVPFILLCDVMEVMVLLSYANYQHTSADVCSLHIIPIGGDWGGA